MLAESKTLEAEIRALLDDEGVVLMDFTVSSRAGRLQIRVVADRRNGAVTVDDCAHLSRQIQILIGEKRLVVGDYRLEVSSPGLEWPLREAWQFAKNVGRLLKVRLATERGPREISGRLLAADAEGITLAAEKKRWTPRYSELLSACVLPEFNPPPRESGS